MKELKQKDKELKKDSRIPELDDEHMMIFQKAKKRYYGWEQELIERYEAKVVDSSKIAKMQNSVVLTLSFYDLEELVEIKPKPSSCYILSASEPYNEEMQIDYERMTNWLNHYGLPQYHVHISGHIMPLQLKETLQTIKPKQVFPIHGAHPELFNRFMKDLKSKITIVEKEKEYVLK